VAFACDKYLHITLKVARYDAAPAQLLHCARSTSEASNRVSGLNQLDCSRVSVLSPDYGCVASIAPLPPAAGQPCGISAGAAAGSVVYLRRMQAACLALHDRDIVSIQEGT